MTITEGLTPEQVAKKRIEYLEAVIRDRDLKLRQAIELMQRRRTPEKVIEAAVTGPDNYLPPVCGRIHPLNSDKYCGRVFPHTRGACVYVYAVPSDNPTNRPTPIDQE